MQVRVDDQSTYPHRMSTGFVSRGVDMGASAPCMTADICKCSWLFLVTILLYNGHGLCCLKNQNFTSQTCFEIQTAS